MQHITRYNSLLILTSHPGPAPSRICIFPISRFSVSSAVDQGPCVPPYAYFLSSWYITQPFAFSPTLHVLGAVTACGTVARPVEAAPLSSLPRSLSHPQAPCLLSMNHASSQLPPGRAMRAASRESADKHATVPQPPPVPRAQTPMPSLTPSNTKTNSRKAWSGRRLHTSDRTSRRDVRGRCHIRSSHTAQSNARSESLESVCCSM